MANILMITDYYPPRKSIASNRMEAFAKYLTEFGHKVYVITIGDKTEHVEGVIDLFRCKDNATFKMANTAIVENKYRHYIKCAYNIILNSLKVYSTEWVNEIVHCARTILTEIRIDVIITSYPSIGPMLAGERIKREFPQIRWIADMRDAVWTPGNNVIIRSKLCRFTRKVFEYADAILSVSDPQRKKYEKMTDKPCFVVKNGYDFEPFFYEDYVKNSSFVVVYAGNFYGARSPKNFLTACKNLINKGLVPLLRFEIIGNHSVVELDTALVDRVILKERMEYDALIDYCHKTADLLLVVVPKSREEGMFTGKIFDYVGIGKPIIGLVPSGDVAEQLIKKIGNGYVSEDEDIQRIEDVLLKAYDDWEFNKRKLPDRDVVMGCHRKETIRELNGIIDSLLNR